ncbi:MAG TPA: hypothetical protein VGQ34_11350 [Sphingomicrobium sp.]|jgi:hypothetical protein|nr:hypothetical protein [Sphingomicrobium sp.]
MNEARAIVGVSDHAGWAVFVIIDRTGRVLDRRKLELKDEKLPAMPHHSESRRQGLLETLALIERVRQSAQRHSPAVLSELEHRLGRLISSIALREIPRLPQTMEERIRNYWANSRADGVMYREELARAAKMRGWTVGWFGPSQLKRVQSSPLFQKAESQASKHLGTPWNADHRLALAGAISLTLGEA